MRWIIGALALSAIAMSLSLLPTILLQIRDRSLPIFKNTALRLSLAMFIHSLGGVILFLAMWSPGFKIGSEGVALYAIFTAYFLWLVSKSMIISVGSGFKLYISMLCLWTGLALYQGWI